MEILTKDLWKIMANLPDAEAYGNAEYIVPVLEEITPLMARIFTPYSRIQGKQLVFKKVYRDGKLRWALEI